MSTIDILKPVTRPQTPASVTDAVDGAPVALSDEEGAKGRIVNAAVSLFSEKGYEATAVREIVKAAGVTKPVLYYYFKNKEALFLHIITETLENYRQRTIEVCEGEYATFIDRLKALARIYIDVAHANPDLVRFMHTISFSNLYDNVFDFPAYWRQNFLLVADIFRRAQEKGLIRPDMDYRTVARHFLGMAIENMRDIVYRLKLTDEPITEDDVVGILMAGVAAPATVEAGKEASR